MISDFKFFYCFDNILAGLKLRIMMTHLFLSIVFQLLIGSQLPAHTDKSLCNSPIEKYAIASNLHKPDSRTTVKMSQLYPASLLMTTCLLSITISSWRQQDSRCIKISGQKSVM